MKIAGSELDGRPLIVAEVSSSHNGSKQRAIDLIQAAKDAGADLVKFQAYTPDTITLDHDGPGFTLRSGPWKGRKLYELYQEAHTPWDWFPDIFSYAKMQKIGCFCSVFDQSSVDMLERLSCQAYKIASFDIVDIPLIKYVAKTSRPIIISTGMADKAEISAATDALPADYPQVFLHCVSGYPTPIDQANLWRIGMLKEHLQTQIGISDHTLGWEVPVAATALGAVLIEKHLCMSRSQGGPDAGFSLEPHEFRQMVDKVRAISLGMTERLTDSEEYKSARKSLYVVADIPAGGTISLENVRAIRPAYGLPPKFLESLVGRRVTSSLKRGSPLSWDDLQS